MRESRSYGSVRGAISDGRPYRTSSLWVFVLKLRRALTLPKGDTTTMREWWKTVAGFAVLGFAITASFYVLWTYHDYAKAFGPLDFGLYAVNVILCPPILLFSWCIDFEYGTPAGVQTNLITVGLLNAALYAMIGIAVARHRKKCPER